MPQHKYDGGKFIGKAVNMRIPAQTSARVTVLPLDTLSEVEGMNS